MFLLNGNINLNENRSVTSRLICVYPRFRKPQENLSKNEIIHPNEISSVTLCASSAHRGKNTHYVFKFRGIESLRQLPFCFFRCLPHVTDTFLLNGNINLNENRSVTSRLICVYPRFRKPQENLSKK